MSGLGHDDYGGEAVWSGKVLLMDTPPTVGVEAAIVQMWNRDTASPPVFHLVDSTISDSDGNYLLHGIIPVGDDVLIKCLPPEGYQNADHSPDPPLFSPIGIEHLYLNWTGTHLVNTGDNFYVEQVV
jgi:hypothetical protein